jgi:hypothetical protein
MKLYIALIEHGPRERCADWIEKLAQDFWVLSKRQLSELTRAIGTIGEDHPINERYYSNILSEFAKPLHIQMWLGFAAWIGRRLEG